MKTVEVKDYLLVEVPEGKEIKLGKVNDEYVHNGYYLYSLDENNIADYNLCLPKGNYQIIGLAKDLTEEQWSNIVERYDEHCINGCWPDYTRKAIFSNQYILDTATESGHSLLKHHGLELSTTLVLHKTKTPKQ